MRVRVWLRAAVEVVGDYEQAFGFSKLFLNFLHYSKRLCSSVHISSMNSVHQNLMTHYELTIHLNILTFLSYYIDTIREVGLRGFWFITVACAGGLGCFNTHHEMGKMLYKNDVISEVSILSGSFSQNRQKFNFSIEFSLKTFLQFSHNFPNQLSFSSKCSAI